MAADHARTDEGNETADAVDVSSKSFGPVSSGKGRPRGSVSFFKIN